MSIGNIQFLLKFGIIADGVIEWCGKHGLVLKTLLSYIKTDYEKDQSKFDELIALYAVIISEFEAKITLWKSIIRYFKGNSIIIVSNKFEIFCNHHCSFKNFNNEDCLNFLDEVLARSTWDDTLFDLLSFTPKIEQFFVL